jgi:hypothetical protein
MKTYVLPVFSLHFGLKEFVVGLDLYFEQVRYFENRW